MDAEAWVRVDTAYASSQGHHRTDSEDSIHPAWSAILEFFDLVDGADKAAEAVAADLA